MIESTIPTLALGLGKIVPILMYRPDAAMSARPAAAGFEVRENYAYLDVFDLWLGV